VIMMQGSFLRQEISKTLLSVDMLFKNEARFCLKFVYVVFVKFISAIILFMLL